MNEQLPFLQAIAANPADDLPRLIFADFLEESGEPDSIARAHFIRAQIALVELLPGSPAFRDTIALQNRLFEMYSEDWIWDLPEPRHAEGNPAWRRGFIEFVRMSWEDFVRDTEMFETVPITRVQAFRANYNHGITIAEVDRTPHVERITHLQIGPSMRPDALDSDNSDTDGILKVLLVSRGFRSLTHLDLSANNFNNANLIEFVLRLPDAAFAQTLRSLDLSELYGLDDAIGNVLATARGLELLERLSLKQTQLADPVRAILRQRFGIRVQF